MKNRTTSLTIFVSFLLLLSCSEKVGPGSTEVRRQQVTGVTLAHITPSSADSYYETAGTVKPRSMSIISARTTGTVRVVKVREGQHVQAGQLLLVLDDRDSVQRLAAAEAGYKEAQKGLDEAEQRRSFADITHKRYKNLAEEKVITPHEMDQIETQKNVADIGYERAKEGVSRARAHVEEARINKGFSNITAPFSGLITEKKIEEGSLATPGTPLLTLEDTSQYRVDAYVDERLNSKVKIGMPVPVILTAQGRQITGNLGEIVHAVDPLTRTFLTKVFIKDPSLRSGLFARVLIPEGKKDALLVPRGAVVVKGQLSGIYVVDEKGIMTYRIVKPGRIDGDRIEVLSGLRPGERIVVGGTEKAIDGGIIKQ